MGNEPLTRTEPSYPEPIVRALRRLILCNRLREYSSCQKPVLLADLRWKERIFTWLTNFTHYTRSKRNILVRQIFAPFLLEPFLLITLRLFLYKKTTDITPKNIAKSIRDTIKAVLHRLYYYDSLSSTLTCFRNTNDKEDLERKYCILLCAMGRYGDAVEQLSKAFLEGRNHLLAARWLSYFFIEIGDMQAAEDILRFTSIAMEDNNNQKVTHLSKDLSKVPVGAKSHQYGIVIPSMADSPVFRSSLISLLESDFRGHIIVVEDGLENANACEKFCDELSIEYVKLESHCGPSECFNVGIQRLDLEIDLIILAHNDVLWPRQWFSELSSVWDTIYDYDKVGLINLGYLQFNANETLRELFIRRNYEDLSWILKRLLKVSYLKNLVQDVQVDDMKEKFGFAYDPWNTEFDKCKVMAGRWSVAVSLPRQIWTNMGGFSPKVFLADLELQNHCMRHKKLMLWTSNAPLIHCRSADTNNLDSTGLLQFKKMEAETYRYCKEKYGWEIDHFLSVLFEETYITYAEEIINAANGLRFSDVDFIFDYFDRRLSAK